MSKNKHEARASKVMAVFEKLYKALRRELPDLRRVELDVEYAGGRVKLERGK